MANENDNRRASPQDSLSNLLAFLDEDPAVMAEEELDEYLSEAGFDFLAFTNRLNEDIELAIRSSRLVEARSNRATFLSRAKELIDLATMSVEQKREEIQARLGLLGGSAAAVYNRNYENTADEDGLDELLHDLRSLDERAGDHD